MKRMIGFALLCAAMGMFLILLIPSTSILRVMLFCVCLAAGYVLFWHGGASFLLLVTEY